MVKTTTVRDSKLPGWARVAEPVCEAIAALLHPYGEVVLHELESDRILAIWNSFSGRRRGDPALLAELPQRWQDAPVQGPYRKVGRDGTELSAISALLSDEEGVPRGLLCVNLDRSPLLDLQEVLDRLFAPKTEPPSELFENDWREQINAEVDAFVRERNGDRRRMPREARVELVRRLEAAGLFEIRHAADHVAAALGVSRATVYSLLKEARS